MKYLDKKAIKMLIILGVSIIVLIIGALVINLFKGTTLSYEKIEEKLVSAAKSYYNKNSNALPIDENDTIEVNSTLLSEEGHMKSIEKYQKDTSIACYGKVFVTKTRNDYYYSPYLNCGDKYTTKYLREKLLEDLTDEKDGLYAVDQLSTTESKKTYVYRGEYVNNYIKFNKSFWRIVKINSDDTILIVEADYDKAKNPIVWDDHYNVEVKDNSGINIFDTSRVKRALMNYYNSEKLYNDVFKNRLISKQLCVGLRKKSDTKNDGSIECSKVDGDYLYFGILPTYDFINASLDKLCVKIGSTSCSNYNYLNKYDRTWWLLNTSDIGSNYGYTVDSSVDVRKLSTSAHARLTANLNQNVLYKSGTGSYSDPYILK